MVNPAVHLARNGFNGAPVLIQHLALGIHTNPSFVVTQDLIRYMDFATQGYRGNFLVEDPVWAEDFAPNGTLLELGDVITRKRYAE